MKIKKEPIFITTADNKQVDINKYLPLVKNIVYKVSSSLIKSSELYLDLQSAGYIGLVEAAKNYDTAKSSFTTFAYSHIRGRVLRALTHEQKEDHSLTSITMSTSGPASFVSGVLTSVKSNLDLLQNEYNPEDTLHNKIDITYVDSIIDLLFGSDSLEKKILTLRYKEERVFTDIGRELGIHYKTAEIRHTQALAKIRAYIVNKKKPGVVDESKKRT